MTGTGRLACATLLCTATLAGCETTLDIRVWTYPNATLVELYDADCDCERLAPPFVGQRDYFTDTPTSKCTCDMPSTCIEAVQIERDGGVVVGPRALTANATNWFARAEGDFAGASLVLVGCDSEIRVQLAEYPPAPTITDVQIGSSTQVDWTADPSSDLTLVRVGALWGEWCVVDSAQTSVTLRSDGSGTVSVKSIRALPVQADARGGIRTYGAAVDDRP